MAGGFGEGCVCMMFMCVVLTSQGGYERHIHSDSLRFYRCLALTSTVMVAYSSDFQHRGPWGDYRDTLRGNDYVARRANELLRNVLSERGVPLLVIDPCRGVLPSSSFDIPWKERFAR